MIVAPCSQVPSNMWDVLGAAFSGAASSLIALSGAPLMAAQGSATFPIVDVALDFESQGTDTPYTPDSGVNLSETPILPGRKFDKLIPKAAVPALDPTSVHTEETSVQLPSRLSYGEELRLKYPNEWDATADAYSAWDSDDGGSRLDRLEECRAYAWFAIHETTGIVRVLSSACHLRWCPLCAEARARFLAHSVRAWYKSARAPKLLTLTLRHSDTPLQSQIDFLYECFRKLRRSKYISSRVRGGIWFFQIKWSKKTAAWHPHIHALIDADFIPQAQIKARWAKFTKGSDVVDIRACWSPDSAANHVGRYATRPGTLSSA
ncbi:unnamed protein product, partial [marine sediment metagenome]